MKFHIRCHTGLTATPYYAERRRRDGLWFWTQNKERARTFTPDQVNRLAAEIQSMESTWAIRCVIDWEEAE